MPATRAHSPPKPCRPLSVLLLLAQAWGLMELQRGNIVAAVKLLERCAEQDPRNLPVLKWKPVREAQLSVQSMKGARRASR